MKKFQLETDFNTEMVLLGLVSQEKSHRLAWLITHILGIAFQREADLVWHAKDEPVAYYARYDALDELNKLEYHLLDNRYEGHVLVSDLKQIDYLLTIRGALEFLDLKSCITRLKQLTEIRLVSEIPLSSIKQLDHLILPETYSKHDTP